MQFDKDINADKFRAQISCAINEANASNILEKFVGNVKFRDEIYFMPASDYNYGIISISDEKRVKVTFLPDLFGRIRVEDIVVVKIDNPRYDWFRYNFKESKFEHQNEICLKCHIRKSDSKYLFNQSEYQKVID